MTKLDILLLAFAILVLIAGLIASNGNSKLKTNEQIKMQLAELELTARRPLTPFEEKMFFALTAALPECTVLAQVSFQALLDTPHLAYRNRFNRKTADFLVCSKQLTPIAIIELDDASHNNKTAQDADRDAMLRNVGYNTIRYKKIPTTEQLQADIENALRMLTSTVTRQENSTSYEPHL